MTMKEAEFYKKLNDKKVHCTLCPHSCIIENGETGICKVRMNVNGKLKNLLYNNPKKFYLRKIEDFSVYHVKPWSYFLGLDVSGTNLVLKNDDLYNPEEDETISLPSAKVYSEAEKKKATGIILNEDEPLINYEYIKEVLKKSDKINLLRTYGYVEEEPLLELIPYLKGVVIDIKSMTPDFYENFYSADLDDILSNLKLLKRHNIWIEVFFEILPNMDESVYDVRKLTAWILNNLGAETPLHIYAKDNTKIQDTLKKMRKTSMDAGMYYVYLDLPNFDEGRSTFCPNCKKIVIERKSGAIINSLLDGRCKCNREIEGIW